LKAQISQGIPKSSLKAAARGATTSIRQPAERLVAPGFVMVQKSVIGA